MICIPYAQAETQGGGISSGLAEAWSRWARVRDAEKEGNLAAALRCAQSGPALGPEPCWVVLIDRSAFNKKAVEYAAVGQGGWLPVPVGLRLAD
jgi:hypothetical protein